MTQHTTASSLAMTLILAIGATIITGLIAAAVIITVGCADIPTESPIPMGTWEPTSTLSITHTTPTPTPTPTPRADGFSWDNYYNAECAEVVTGDVYDHLANRDWGESYQYEEDVFDCSEMSAYMEWMLENNGYHTVIMLRPGHAWICVEFDDGYIAYECTTGRWVHRSEDMAYYEGTAYESLEGIETMLEGYSNGEEVFAREWMWWS